MGSPQLTRRERRKITNREEILEAALDIFTQKGFHAASMKEIAERADFATGTLYSFFESKEALYKALLIDQCVKMGRVFDAALDEGENELETLLQFVHTKERVFHEYRHILELYSTGLKGEDMVVIRAGQDADVRGLYDKLLTRLSGIFQRGIDRGLFRPLDPDRMALGFEGLTNAFLADWRQSPAELSKQDKEKIVRELFFEGVSA